MTFEELYDQHFEFVWRTLRRVGVPEAELPDVAQEVFLVVHRRLAAFEERSKVTTWLFRIAARAARDRRRRAATRHEIPVATAVLDAVQTLDDPSLSIERADDLALLDQALARLDQDQREVFVAFELEGLTCETIASALEVPLGTVYSRLRLGREKFRQSVARLLAIRDGAGLRAVGGR